MAQEVFEMFLATSTKREDALKMLTIQQLADLTNLSVGMIQKQIKEGHLKSRNFGSSVRIPYEEGLRFARGKQK